MSQQYKHFWWFFIFFSNHAISPSDVFKELCPNPQFICDGATRTDIRQGTLGELRSFKTEILQPENKLTHVSELFGATPDCNIYCDQSKSLMHDLAFFFFFTLWVSNGW